MKTLMFAAAIFAGLASQAAADGSKAKTSSVRTHPIYVSCFRGPWTDVIWDRPNAKFIDSLVSVGYDYPTAHAIGERVCRDEALVSNPDGMKAEMLRIYRDSPEYRAHYRRK